MNDAFMIKNVFSYMYIRLTVVRTVPTQPCMNHLNNEK